jgi:D-arabinose 1-dehydrogenase-like Zn-dependent alcohol dehydrogenase
MGSLPEFERLLHFVETAAITPLVDSTFPLAHARRAFDRLVAGGHTGKIVIEMSDRELVV